MDRNYKIIDEMLTEDRLAIQILSQELPYGFPKDMDIQNAFVKAPPHRDTGFGLYFIGLAAKVLQAKVGVSSEPGNTTVSFFHPVYPTNTLKA